MSDVTKIFFIVEGSVKQCKKKEDDTIMLIEHLHGCALDVLYDFFAENEEFMRDGKN